MARTHELAQQHRPGNPPRRMRCKDNAFIVSSGHGLFFDARARRIHQPHPAGHPTICRQTGPAFTPRFGATTVYHSLQRQQLAPGIRTSCGENQLREARIALVIRKSKLAAKLSNGTEDHATEPNGPVGISYLQCVSCGAVYTVDCDELDDEPRVVRCCACLHEWYAEESDLIWGDKDAAAAIETQPEDQSVIASLAIRDMERDRADRDETSPDDPVDNESGMEMNTADGGPGSLHSQRSGTEAPENGADGFDGLRSSSVNNPALNADETSSQNGTAKVRTDGGGLKAVTNTYNIFVGNLSFRATEEDLFRAFSGYGIVIKCQIPMDPTGTSRGYGFVEMSGTEEGEHAMACLQGASILGRDIWLSKARPRANLRGPASGMGTVQNVDLPKPLIEAQSHGTESERVDSAVSQRDAGDIASGSIQAAGQEYVVKPDTDATASADDVPGGDATTHRNTVSKQDVKQGRPRKTKSSHRNRPRRRKTGKPSAE